MVEESIFHFIDRGPLAVKCDKTSDKLYNDFWSVVSKDEDYLTQNERSSLERIRDACNPTWFTEFGSVVIEKDCSLTESSISFVALDTSKTFVHSSLVGAPNVRNPVIVEFGSFSTPNIMQDARRQFWNNVYGQRRTQSTAFRCFESALMKAAPGQLLPRVSGYVFGFDDRAVIKNVSFPLVLSAIHAMLLSSISSDEQKELFNKCVSIYLLTKIQDLVQKTTSNEYCGRSINRCVTAARELEPFLSPIKDGAFKDKFKVHLKSFYCGLKELAPARDKTETEHLGESVVQACQSLHPPNFPTLPLFQKDDFNVSQIESDSMRNLNWSSLSGMQVSGTGVILQEALVKMHRLNYYFWGIARSIKDSSAKAKMDDILAHLKWLDTAIGLVADHAKSDPRLMSVLFRSYKVLAHWISYCWADRFAVESHPVYGTCAPALDPTDLMNLVLDDKRAIDALECVRTYLKGRHADHDAKPFANAEDTMALAFVVASVDDSIGSKYKKEMIGANTFVSERKQKIGAAKRKRADLFAQLSKARQNLKVAKQEQSAVEQDLKSTLEKVIECRTKIISYSQEVHKSQTEFEHVKTPEVVAFRLPSQEKLALQWMFFIFMPVEFQVLCKLTMSAQSQLWEEVPVLDCSEKTNLHHWFENHHKGDPTIGEPAQDLPLCLWTSSKSLQSSLPASNSGYDAESKVLFPDCPSDTLIPIWKGGQDLFAHREACQTARIFTEPLCESYDRANFMQQFLEVIPTKEKENRGIAEGYKKPKWLTQEQFLCFASLRCAPRSQIRSLIDALCNDSLPFDHSCVHLLIKQLLFQAGESDWKHDIFGESSKGLAAVGQALKNRANLLKDAPKLSESLLVFGVISSFFGQFDEACRSCARRFASIARKWADDLKQDHKLVSHVPDEVQWNITRYYAFAMLCYPLGTEDENDLVQCCELIFLYQQNLTMSTSVAEHRSLHLSVINSMASRIQKVLDIVKGQPKILTKLVNLIRDEQLPESLSWSPVSYDGNETGCFKVYHKSGDSNRLYSVNILNGTLLINGTTPGFLPSSIVQNPQYCRIFGSQNFEVEPIEFRHYRTRRAFDKGLIFDFLVNQSGELQIIETDTSTGEKLENVRSCSIDLPNVVREKHSHWFSQKFEAVFLRGGRYNQRQIRYVVQKESTFFIPEKYRGANLQKVMDILPKCEIMLLGKTSLSTVLSRFESEDFILHFLSPDKSVLRHSLARYNLDFEQSNDAVSSAQFRDCVLANVQSLRGTLPGFESFLALKNRNGQEKVLIPDLIFEKARVQEDCWRLKASPKPDASMRYHVFHVHSRLKTLIAADIEGRLYLAALYAWTSTLLPDPGMGQPGTTIATTLVRQCWKNEPLSDPELRRLLNVSMLSKLCCTLKLITSWLYKSSISVIYLHEEKESELDLSCLTVDPVAVWQYRRGQTYAPRLLSHEEILLLRTQHQSAFDGLIFPNGAVSELSRFVRDTELQLRNNFIKEELNQFDRSRPFVLNRPGGDFLSPLGSQIWDDLESSHNVHRQLPSKSLKRLDLTRSTNRIAQEVNDKRQFIENEILSHFESGDSSVGFHLSLLTCQQGKLVGKKELLCFLCDSASMMPYVNHLRNEDQKQLYLNIRDWALLCVLEDKLGRINRALNDRHAGQESDDHALIRELDCVREWNADEHPRWLAFEVEQAIQIRPEQYLITRQLLDNRASIVQLNMGLGKTRVILPMLILEMLTKKELVRVNVLQPIMKEALHYYRNVLVASLQHIRVATLPFQRDTIDAIEESHASLISKEVQNCRLGLCCFLVTPQHRNSLALKQYDDNNAFVPALSEEFVDILDESDAILDSKLQLVYALGKQVPLPDGSRRWYIAEACLKLLSQTSNSELSVFLSNRNLVHKDQVDRGSFSNIRLLKASQTEKAQFGKALSKELLTWPPRECLWMEQVSDVERDTLITIMTDSEFDPQDEIESSELFRSHKSDILTARGLIAFGLLFHGLSMRYRVDFGLKQGSKKLMAVPYAAADTPKARAEFSQPDMAILYTCISYLREGLSIDQLERALKDLQNLAPQAQESIYSEWIQDVHIPPEDRMKIDDIRKIDADNRMQLNLCYRYLYRSMGAICFWMNNRVFPSETFQFPEKRASSAWNLATKSTIGFSGTDDNRFLVPLQVKQIAQASEELRATNGSMIECIVACTQHVKVLEEKDDLPFWKTVLNKCLDVRCDALIDAGGLMAGSSSSDILNSFSRQLIAKNFKGLVFFHTVNEAWTVHDFELGSSLPLCNSSLTEAECFVYFDESRCRGSDLKLCQTACALVTLEAGITKDKFLQGCARMRNLRPGKQSLILAGTNEIVDDNSSTEAILQKILDNTVIGIAKDLTVFYERGLEYTRFPSPVKESISLEDLYGRKTCAYRDFGTFVDAQHEFNTEQQSQLKSSIEDYCKSIGSSMEVQSTKLSQECERELEEEALCEMEWKPIMQEPFAQVDWEYSNAFTDPTLLFQKEFTPLTTFMKDHLVARGKGVEQASSVKWSSKLYCTSNFWKTIKSCGLKNDLSSYLRLVNAMLVLQDGRVILITSYELDKLLPYWWHTSSQRKRLRESGKKTLASIQHLFQYESGSLAPDMKFGQEETKVPADVLASVKLFAGKVNFSQRELKELKKMLREVSDRQGLVLRLLSMRGRVDSFERSSLDDYRLLTDQQQSSGNGGQNSDVEVIELDDSSDEEGEMEKLEKAGISADQLRTLRMMGLKITSV